MITKLIRENLSNKKINKLIMYKRRLQNGFIFNNKKGSLNKNNKIFIGTHHKTGTVWFQNIFKDIASYFSLLYATENLKDDLDYNDFHFVLNHHSQFDFTKLNEIDYKGIHIIRDPRDMIISSTFYHQKSKESWLHVSKKEFNGLTYQEKINSFDTFEEKAIFEINNSAGNNILDIKKWDYSNDNFLEVKYEEVIQDYNLQKFHDIFEFLGFHGEFIPDLLRISWKNSLFSGEVKSNKHVRSGDARQYQKHFTPKLKKEFKNEFGDLLVKLGYEENNNW